MRKVAVGTGEAYRVHSIPDLFFINREGFVTGRLQNFEPPAAFIARLRALLRESAGARLRGISREAMFKIRWADFVPGF